ncbi:MAG: hypothetical protein L3K03_09055, partial [Thermoplasmata archaeon]|nr:hypothetical protein [Thermoplasmata archaeon]
IEENLPRAAEDPQHLWEGFVRLAGASELLSRARRTRNFGLWSYASELATGGVSIAIDRTSGSRVNIRFPEFLMAMGRSKISRGLRTEIAGRVGSSAHMSRRKSVDTVLPMLERIFDPARAGFQAPAVARLRSRCILTWGLTPEQVGYLMGREPGSPEVVTEVERSLTLEPNRSASAPAAAAIEEANPPPKASGHAQRHLGDF